MSGETMTRAENDRLGVLTGPDEITFVRLLPGPAERVWSFLADSDKRGLWLASGEMEPRVGGKVTLQFHNALLGAPGETVPERHANHAGVIHSGGEVTAWEPPHRLAFLWGEDAAASLVTITLADEADGRVRLTLVHSKLKDRAEARDVSGGWHAHLGVLVAVLEGRAEEKFWATLDEVEPIYDAALPP